MHPYVIHCDSIYTAIICYTLQYLHAVSTQWHKGTIQQKVEATAGDNIFPLVQNDVEWLSCEPRFAPSLPQRPLDTTLNRVIQRERMDKYGHNMFQDKSKYP